MDAGLTGDLERAREAAATGHTTTEPTAEPTATPADLAATLDHLERLCGRLERAEARFQQLTDECEDVLKDLVSVDRRHSSVVAGLNDRLGDWCQLESKLLAESARRIEQFERGVGHEWMVLRQLHEEPLAQLKDDADQLRMACLEAARTARFRFDSVEKAFTTYTADLDRRLTELSRDLLGAVKASTSPAQPWPLEGVAQLHQELRAGATTLALAAPATGAGPSAAPAVDAAGEESIVDAGKARRTRWRLTTRGAATLALGGLIVLALGGYAIVRPTGSPAPTPVGPHAVSTGAAREGDTASKPDDRVAEAARAAERAGTMVDILAAADLRRYALAGTSPNAPNQPYGQVLWSRSRGLAASASRLPAAPPGKVYHLWIVPDGPAVSAGVLVPDAAGRAALLLAGPLKLPVPVTLRVTLEDRDNVTSPRGPVCLVRVPAS